MFILSPFYTPKYREGSERFFGRVEGWGRVLLAVAVGRPFNWPLA